MNFSLPCPVFRPLTSPFHALQRSMTGMLSTYQRNGLTVSTREEIQVKGAAIIGLARKLEGVEARQTARQLKGQWLRWVWKWIYRLYYRAEPVLYEVTAL